MAAPYINYHNKKSFLNITSNTDTLVTNCTGISIENKGEVSCSMTVEDTIIILHPGEALVHSNDPDVLEITEYTNLTFDEGEGEKLLFVTKEFITPIED